MIPLCRPPLSDEAVRAVISCLRSGWWGYGALCRSLEQEFADRFGGWALATSSCTSALYIAARLLKQEASDEVIVPALTFLSTPMSFKEAGYKVRIADVEPGSLVLSASTVEPALTQNTRAVVAVDLYGQKAATPELVDFCRRRNIALIEDRAHRLDLEDVPLGEIACFSFNAVKEAPGGEGGLLWGRGHRPNQEKAARAISNVGLDIDTRERSSVPRHPDYRFAPESGLKLRLSDISASLVLEAIRCRGEYARQRRQIFHNYNEALHPLAPNITPVSRSVTERNSCLMYVVRVRGVDRELLRDDLARQGVATSVHYSSVTEHPLFADDAEKCPEALAAAREVVTLPCFPGLSAEDQERVVRALYSSLKVHYRA